MKLTQPQKNNSQKIDDEPLRVEEGIPPRLHNNITPNQIWIEAIRFVNENLEYIHRLAKPWIAFSCCTQEDIEHEALLAIYHAIEDVSIKGQWDRFVGYFYTHFRKRLNKLSTGVPTVSYSESDAYGSNIRSPFGRTPEDLTSARETSQKSLKEKQKAIDWALNKMTMSQKTVWEYTIRPNLKGRLRDVEEIADWMGMDPRDLKRIKARGLETLTKADVPKNIRTFAKEYITDEKVGSLI